MMSEKTLVIGNWMTKRQTRSTTGSIFSRASSKQSRSRLSRVKIFFEICRYRRSSAENWGWPPLFRNEKPLFPPISHQKKRQYILLILMQKQTYPIGKPDFRKRKTKDIQILFGPNWRLSHTKIFAWKKVSVTIVAKSSLVEKKTNIRFHHL